MSQIIHPDMLPGYFSAGFKVGWAKHHLRSLDKLVVDWLGSDPKPYTFETKDDLEAGEHVIKFNIEAAPLEMWLIVGDFVACLRGSLDHLATALTSCPGGTYNDRASFPIIGVDDKDGRSGFARAVRGIPDGAVEVIKSLQPYHTGDAYKVTKLWRLHRLWNIDKHRKIPLQPISVNLKMTHSAEHSPLPARTYNSGVVRFPLSAKPYIEVNPTMEVTINFGDEAEGIIVPYSDLIDIHNFVRDDVMPRFKRFF